MKRSLSKNSGPKNTKSIKLDDTSKRNVFADSNENKDKQKNDSGKKSKPKWKLYGEKPVFGKKSPDKSFPTKQSGPLEKPDWIKIKTEKKVLREKRKVSNNSFYESYKEAKKLWEELRQSTCPPENVPTLSRKILKLFEGHLTMVARSHDMARVIQTLLRLGPPDVKEKIASNLLTEIVPIMGSKHGRHIVKSIFKHCPLSSKKVALKHFKGSVIKIISNQLSAPLFEEVYSKVASPHEKLLLKNEIYGSIAETCAADGVFSLSNIVSNPDLKLAILNKTGGIITKLLQKKHCLSLSLVHSALFEYLSLCDGQTKTSILNTLRESPRLLLSSKDGCKVFSFVLWASSTKEKKVIVKDLKTDIVELSKGEYTSVVVMTVFDSVDDTVLLKKALIAPLVEHIEGLVESDHGNRVVKYLTAHRDPSFFHPELITWLKQAEESSSVKKETNQRIKELQEAFLSKWVEKISTNFEFWFGSGKIAMDTLAVIKASSGDQLKLMFDKLSEYLLQSSEEELVLSKVNELPGMHMILKKIIKNDQNISSPDETFSSAFVDKLDKDSAELCLKTNRGCFILVNILEAGIEPACKKLKTMLSKIGLTDHEDNAGLKILKKHIS